MRLFPALFLIALVLSVTSFFSVEGRVEAKDWEMLKAQAEELLENKKALADSIVTAVSTGVQGIIAASAPGAAPLDVVKSVFSAVTGIVTAALGGPSPTLDILNSVFTGVIGIIDTAIKSAPATVAPVAPPPPPPSGGASIGCYKDGLIRAMNTGHFSNLRMSSALCRPFCQGSKYFGLQFGTHCFCGNDYTKFGAAAATDCNKPCAGNRAEMCGGWFRNSVYAV